MPNAFAYLALLLALPVGIAMFFIMRAPLAAMVVFLGSMMFLPEVVELDLPGLPGLGKQEIAALACFLGLLLRARRKLRAARMLRGVDGWMVLMILGAFGTVFTNRDLLSYGPVELPALTFHEGVSVAFTTVLHFLLPFVVGRALFVTAKDLKTALAALAIAGAVYTPFLFVELMLSPQLHNWVYGFHQHDFIQTLRGGGYRPMVFMNHGLAVAMFMVWSVLAGMTLVRAKKRVFAFPAVMVTPYVFAFLLVIKSLGAAIYAIALSPVMALFKPRALVRVATVLAVVVISYPVLRATQLFPADALVRSAYALSGDRAASLEYRFNMESMLSAHATERILFGWGRFKRNMVFDPETGKELSVSDGYWVVVYGVSGAVGFVCFFSYLLSPIFLLRRRLRRVPAPDEKMMLAGLAVILGVAAVDLLPNGLYNTFDVFLAGILYGATRALSSQAHVEQTAQDSAEADADGPMRVRSVQ